MKLIKLAGATSEIWQIWIADTSSTTGAGLPALAFGSGGLTAYFHRDTDTTATAITLVDMTVGTFTSSGFKKIDDTNMPGWYQFCPPNAALASGAKSVSFLLKGAANMAPLAIEVELTAVNPDSATGFVSSVPAVVGAVGSVTGNVGGNVVGTVASVVGAVGSVTGNVGGNVTGSVGSVVGAVGSVTGNVGGNVTGSVGSVVGAVGSVTGAVGSVTGNVGGNVVGTVASVVGNVGGNVTGSVGSVVGAVGSVTGNVGGNVTGSVGSVVGSVGSVTGNVGGNVTGSVGSIAGVSFPSNFGSLAISVAGNASADMKKINGTTVNGDGSGTPWGP